MWGAFKQYHYLTSTLASNSHCYVGFIDKEAVAFVAITPFPHPTNKNIVKVSRVVVLPHWQGFGVGMKMVEAIATQFYPTKDIRFTTTLPIVHNYLWKSSKWALKFQGIRKNDEAGKNATMAKDIREVYLETYQFENQALTDRKVLRTGCPPEKIRKST